MHSVSFCCRHVHRKRNSFKRWRSIWKKKSAIAWMKSKSIAWVPFPVSFSIRTCRHLTDICSFSITFAVSSCVSVSSIFVCRHFIAFTGGVLTVFFRVEPIFWALQCGTALMKSSCLAMERLYSTFGRITPAANLHRLYSVRCMHCLNRPVFFNGWDNNIFSV